MPATLTIPAASAFSWTDGFPANYVAPEEIATRVDYIVEDGDGTSIAAGTVGADPVAITVNDPLPASATVSYVATHFDLAGDGVTGAPLTETVSFTSVSLESAELRPCINKVVFLSDLTTASDDAAEFLVYLSEDPDPLQTTPTTISVATPPTNGPAFGSTKRALRYEVTAVAAGTQYYGAVMAVSANGEQSAPITGLFATPVDKFGVELTALMEAMPASVSLPEYNPVQKTVTFDGASIVTHQDMMDAAATLGLPQLRVGFPPRNACSRVSSIGFFVKRSPGTDLQYIMSSPHVL
mmetsp:Transcript_36537/g.86786  ORF Transcript_36537/g.86786 Transcript_36537/m.86786 type:complete len:296 (-) Transcript_36537:1334-2221(-)